MALTIDINSGVGSKPNPNLSGSFVSSENEDESKDSTLVDDDSFSERNDLGDLVVPTSGLADDKVSIHKTWDGVNVKSCSSVLSEPRAASADHDFSTSSLKSDPASEPRSHQTTFTDPTRHDLHTTPSRPSGAIAGLDGSASPMPQMTSTPIPAGETGSGGSVPPASGSTRCERPQTLSVRLKPPEMETLSAETTSEEEDAGNTSFTSQTSSHTTTTHESQTDLDLYDHIQVPIVGYETMEERSRFTVFKVRVQKSADEGWHIFRRYSDFVRLNETLKQVFPHFRLALPPKKWFGDNYDRPFLEHRMLGLQAFLNNIISHRNVCNSEPVRDFLCVDDPPGPHDSLEESRAQCELLEDQSYALRQDLQTKDARIALLEEELALYKAEVDNLRRALRMERALNTHRRSSPSQSQRSEGSITEHDEASEAEADQGPCHDKASATNSLMTSPEGASTSSWDVISESSRDMGKPSAGTSAVTTTVTPGVTSGVTSPLISAVTKAESVSDTRTTCIPVVTSLNEDLLVPGVTSLAEEMSVAGVTSLDVNSVTPLPVVTSDKLHSATVP